MYEKCLTETKVILNMLALARHQPKDGVSYTFVNQINILEPAAKMAFIYNNANRVCLG